MGKGNYSGLEVSSHLLDTHSPFLKGICDGTLSKEVFNRWLVQDCYFVTAVLRFVSVLLSRSDRHQQSVLTQGMVALDDELVWFRPEVLTLRVLSIQCADAATA